MPLLRAAISRADVADFILGRLSGEEYVRQAVSLAYRRAGGNLAAPGGVMFCMNEHAQEQKLRTNAAKNKVVDPEEIAKAIANLRRVAEAARRRAENQGRAPDKEDGDK